MARRAREYSNHVNNTICRRASSHDAAAAALPVVVPRLAVGRAPLAWPQNATGRLHRVAEDSPISRRSLELPPTSRTEALLGSSCDEEEEEEAGAGGVWEKEKERERERPLARKTNTNTHKFGEEDRTHFTTTTTTTTTAATTTDGKGREEEQSKLAAGLSAAATTTSVASKQIHLQRELKQREFQQLQQRELRREFQREFQRELLRDSRDFPSEGSGTFSNATTYSSGGCCRGRGGSTTATSCCGRRSLLTERSHCRAASGSLTLRDPQHVQHVASGAAPPRVLRVTQRNVLEEAADKAVTTQTRIEVVGVDDDGSEFPLFAVRHFEQVLWGRQMKVHKNILLAAQLAQTEVPASLHLPADAARMYHQTDNSQHVHAFLERVVPHLSLDSLDKQVTMFWWRCVGSGLAILLNRGTGRLLIAPNYEKTLKGAVGCVTKLLNFLQNDVQAARRGRRSTQHSFWTQDPEYPRDASSNESSDSPCDLPCGLPCDLPCDSPRGESRGESRGEPPGGPTATATATTAAAAEEKVCDQSLDSERIKRLCRRWATEHCVLPELTNYVIALGQSRFLRYSVLNDFQNAETLVVQVHLNEPLSRGLNAFPVCYLTLEPETRKARDVKLCFLQAVFFLKKLFEVHQNEVSNSGAGAGGGGGGSGGGFGSGSASGSAAGSAASSTARKLADPPRR